MFQIELKCFYILCSALCQRFGFKRWKSASVENKGKFYFYRTLILPQIFINFHVIFYNPLFLAPWMWMQFSAPIGLCWKWCWVPTRKVPHFSRLKAVADTLERFLAFAVSGSRRYFSFLMDGLEPPRWCRLVLLQESFLLGSILLPRSLI